VEGALGMKNILTDFAKGVIIGFCFGIIIVGLAVGFINHRKNDRELIEYAEKQIEIQELREDIVNRDPVEFLEDPGVRGAADGAAIEFDRKLDEILRAFRQRRNAW
jgi:hypothetical protein